MRLSPVINDPQKTASPGKEHPGLVTHNRSLYSTFFQLGTEINTDQVIPQIHPRLTPPSCHIPLFIQVVV